MAKKTTLKGLQALKSATVAEVIADGDNAVFVENAELFANIDKEVQPQIVKIGEALAEAEKTIAVHEASILTVRLADIKLRNMREQDGPFRDLLNARAELLKKISQNARKENGVLIYRLPDGSDAREALKQVDEEIARTEEKVRLFIAGYYGVSYPEALALVQADDRAYRSRKNSQ